MTHTAADTTWQGSQVEALIDRALDGLGHLERQSPELRHKVDKRSLDSALIAEAAERRGLEVRRLSAQTQILRDGDLAIGFYQNMAAPLTALDRAVTHDKLITKRILGQAGVPLAEGAVAGSMAEALAAFRRIGPPVAVKPVTGSGGRGVTVNVHDEEELRAAADDAFGHASRLLVEEMVAGIDLRIMTIAGRAVAAMLRVPANVVGDGTSSIRGLIEQKNEIRAGNAYLRHCPIQITAFTEHHLALRGLGPDSVPAAGQRVYLHYKANLSAGGDSYEILDEVHPEILRLAERASSAIATSYHAGVDILLERFDRAPDDQRCIVCELNLNNEMPIHIFPLYGKPSATDDETVEGYFSRARADIAAGPHRLDLDPPPSSRRSPGAAGPTSEEFAELARTPGEPAPAPAGRTARAVDRAYLIEELERAGLREVRLAGKLIHGRDDDRPGHDIVLERSGRTVFAGAVAGNATAWHELLTGAGLPALRRLRCSPGDLSAARALVEAGPGPWRLRSSPAGEHASARVDNPVALERAWSHLPEDATRVTLEQVPAGLACSLLMVDGEPCATTLIAPPYVVGDGTSSLAELADRKLRARAAHAYLRHFPIREALLGDDALGRRGLHRGSVPAAGEVIHLARSPLISVGADTVGAGRDPYPDLAELAARALRLVGAPVLATVTFAQRDAGSWGVWRFDPDPVVARDAFPWAGRTVPVYPPVARALLAGQRYVLPRS